MNLQQLLKIFSDKECRKVYVKRLSPNDNSKNQVYLGGNFEVINILPIKEIVSEHPGDWKRMRFKSKMEFYWVNEDGDLSHAPEAQLILYPKYPEVRFSGFLKRARNAPSDLMSNRIDGRLLFFAISDSGRIIGHVVPPASEIANEFNQIKNLEEVGVFKELTIEKGAIQLDSKTKLLEELKRIHQLGWIDAKRLDTLKNILPCISSNCGGYTLEAELGITPNGYSEPDYLGWEIKQFSVKNFNKWQSEVVTLMTPEPTHGYYADEGVEAFIRKYGYEDKRGREARINFGGIHKFDLEHSTTNLKMIIRGFDNSEGKITDTNGFIALLDKNSEIAASWSFVSLLKHWNTKHANACYVPSMNRKDQILYPFSKQQYFYSNRIMLGNGTDFSLVLKQIASGNLYYDPGIKLELAIQGLRKQIIKRRSQFRIKSQFIPNLYRRNDLVDLLKEQNA
jgi:hypothetical protein